MTTEKIVREVARNWSLLFRNWSCRFQKIGIRKPPFVYGCVGSPRNIAQVRCNETPGCAMTQRRQAAALRDFDQADVRFGSGADITHDLPHVRFTSESGQR